MARKPVFFEIGAGDLVQMCLCLAQALIGPVIAAAGVAWLCKLTGLDARPASFWLLVAPMVYLLWAFLLLLFYFLETSLVGLFFERPRRYDSREKRTRLPLFFIGMLYGHAFILNSLPLAPLLIRAPFLNWLILRAYAPKAFIGRGVILAGDISDPDITFIGPGVMIGDNCRIIAHSLTRSPEGALLYQSAPVTLGEACTISGGVQIEMGVIIGACSLIEPGSRIRPFTRVPPGEVWGGNPAVFRRKRTMENTVSAPEAATLPVEAAAAHADADKLHRLIAEALGLPTGQITAASSAQNCPAWDSIGKMAIAAALHDRFGLNLPPETVNQLDSTAAVEKIASVARVKQTAAVPLSLPADPELLSLLDAAPALAALADQSEEASVAPKRIRVVIAATFIAAPLASALQLYARAFGLVADVEFFDFNQVPQALLDPHSPMRKNRAGLNVALIRPEDWPGRDHEERRLQAEHFFSAIKNFATTSGCALLVGDLPPPLSPDRPESPENAAQLTNWWRQQLAPLRGLEVLNFAGIIEELGRTAARAMPAAGETPLPFSPAVYQRLGIGIARTLRKLSRAPKKVLALDADNTLWGGVVGEDGLTGLQLGDDAAGRGFRTLQTEILTLKQRGILLVLTSKNTEADVWNVLDHHPRMLLRRDDFVAARINWQPKSENLRALAAELNLGLDSFVLLDDNPAERLEVAAHCPTVTVVPLPAHPERYAEILSRLWCFDGAGETHEDEIRNAFAQQENQRQKLQQSAGELESYLGALELKVTLRGARAEDLPRVSQLLLKTNQFNLSLKRRTLPETRALLPEHAIWVLSVRDRFGDYGMVGVCITRPENGSLVLDTFLMSCRALGRGAETAFLHGIAQKARLAGALSLRGEFVPGPRNQPISLFLTKYGFSAGPNGWHALDVAQAPAAPRHLGLEIS